MQLPSLIKKKYTDYKSFANQTVEELFGDKLQQTSLLTANNLKSVFLINNGKNGFKLSNLLYEAQWSPVFTFITGDFNHDEKTDIIAAGNFYGVLPYESRYDANYGNVL